MLLPMRYGWLVWFCYALRFFCVLPSIRIFRPHCGCRQKPYACHEKENTAFACLSLYSWCYCQWDILDFLDFSSSVSSVCALSTHIIFGPHNGFTQTYMFFITGNTPISNDLLLFSLFYCQWDMLDSYAFLSFWGLFYMLSTNMSIRLYVGFVQK